MAAGLRADRRDAEVVRRHRRGPAGPVEHRRTRQRAHQGRLADLGVERARHDQPDHRDRRQGARRRRRDGGRRVAGRAAVPGRRLDAGRRPAGLHRSQGGRPDRHRRALGTLRPARLAAAVPRWRRDDRGRPDDRFDVRAAAGQVRGRYAADRAGGRARCGAGLPVRDRDGQGRRPRAGHHGVRAGRPADRTGPEDPRADRPRSTAVERSASSWTAFTRTTCRPCWTPAASRSAPGTTARGRCTSGSECNRRPERLSTCTRHPRRSTRSSTDSDSSDRSSRWTEGYAARQPVPGDHPGPLPQPAPRGARGAVRRGGAPREPVLRGRGHPPGRARRRDRDRRDAPHASAARSARRRPR